MATGLREEHNLQQECSVRVMESFDAMWAKQYHLQNHTKHVPQMGDETFNNELRGTTSHHHNKCRIGNKKCRKEVYIPHTRGDILVRGKQLKPLSAYI